MSGYSTKTAHIHKTVEKINIMYRVVHKKLHQVQCTVILQPFALEPHSFYQNAQKLIGNTKIDKF